MSLSRLRKLSMQWVAPTLLVAAAAACSSTERALKKVHCGAAVAPLVTNVSEDVWGIGRFACVKLLARDDEARRLIESDCELLAQPLAASLYPARSSPAVPPDWWDLVDGDSVDFGSSRDPARRWQGFVYRKAAMSNSVWYLCAGAD